MNKNKILISIISFIAIISLFNFSILDISAGGIIVDLNQFSPLFDSMISLPKDIAMEIWSLLKGIVDNIFSPQVIGTLLFMIVIFALASGGWFYE